MGVKDCEGSEGLWGDSEGRGSEVRESEGKVKGKVKISEGK